MPAYNAERYIEKSIRSAQMQTFENWELIVVDDGSTDNTSSMVKSIAKKDNRIIYFKQSNLRLGAARNAGLSLARGMFIAFLDSDDLWFQEKLELQILAIENMDVDLVFSDGHVFSEKSELLKDYPSSVSGLYAGMEMYQMLFMGNCIPVLSVLMKSSWAKKVGQQSTDISIFGCEDWDYWLRMASLGAVFFGMKEKLFMYRIHDEAMSRNVPVMKLAEFTALYGNLDFTLIDKGIAVARLKVLLRQNLPGLISLGRIGESKKALLKMLKISFNFRYFLLYLILIVNNRKANKYSKFILSYRIFNRTKSY